MEHHFELVAKQRKQIALVLVFMTIFYAYDLVDDWQDGEPLIHMLAELLCVSLTIVISYVLWRSSFESFERSKKLFRDKLSTVELEAAKWRSDAKRLMEGLSLAINAQFDSWLLSPAEKEVALLLLKGFSYNEIASLRSTSERTVRDQSSAVYQKSELAGRAQLAAFFLEDLFMPHSTTGIVSESPSK